MNNTLNNQTFSSKLKQWRCCPFCSMPLIICSGFYDRYHPERGEPVKIQRYQCKAPECPVKTFSILPYPLLRIVRHTAKKIRQVYKLAMAGVNQASISRILGLSRGVVKRLMEFSGRFFPWLAREQGIADWGPDLNKDPCKVWPLFIRDFSHAFYPQRYGKFPSTQYIHCAITGGCGLIAGTFNPSYGGDYANQRTNRDSRVSIRHYKPASSSK